MRGLVLETAKSRQRSTSILPFPTAGEPSGRFGDEEDADSKRERKGHAEANDDAPGGVLLLNVSHAVVDNVGDEDTKGNHELVTSWVLVIFEVVRERSLCLTWRQQLHGFHGDCIQTGTWGHRRRGFQLRGQRRSGPSSCEPKIASQ